MLIQDDSEGDENGRGNGDEKGKSAHSHWGCGMMALRMLHLVDIAEECSGII